MNVNVYGLLPWDFAVFIDVFLDSISECVTFHLECFYRNPLGIYKTASCLNLSEVSFNFCLCDILSKGA